MYTEPDKAMPFFDQAIEMSAAYDDDVLGKEFRTAVHSLRAFAFSQKGNWEAAALAQADYSQLADEQKYAQMNVASHCEVLSRFALGYYASGDVKKARDRRDAIDTLVTRNQVGSAALSQFALLLLVDPESHPSKSIVAELESGLAQSPKSPSLTALLAGLKLRSNADAAIVLAELDKALKLAGEGNEDPTGHFVLTAPTIELLRAVALKRVNREQEAVDALAASRTLAKAEADLAHKTGDNEKFSWRVRELRRLLAEQAQ